jgi:hypothetical protein
MISGENEAIDRLKACKQRKHLKSLYIIRSPKMSKSKSNLQKLPPAKITAIVERLQRAGITAWMTHESQAAFAQGMIGLPPGTNIPLVAFDIRATPDERSKFMAALQGVGTWAIANTPIYLERTPAGIKVLTWEQAKAKLGIDVLTANPDCLSGITH